MKVKISTTQFYTELESSLPTSSGEKRKLWATAIIENDIAIKDLAGLLKCEHKIASRFLWLLSDVGIINPDKLFTELPFLLVLCDSINPVYQTSFASWWHYAGIPPENDGRAIDLLFQWLLSSDTNVTLKTRSIWVLVKLTKKYPGLRNELKLCLNDQKNKHSANFEKTVTKILKEIDSH